MAYKIRYNKTFLKDTFRIANWLEKEWSEKVSVEFIKLLYNRIDELSKTPFAGSLTIKVKNVRRLKITKHNKIYYRVKGDIVTVLAIFETHQNPEKNKYE
jgi:plasmid stabilization system protein ParE